MGSLSEINFNYEQAMRQARTLEELAEKITNASERDMGDILNDVNSAWKSDNSAQYLKKGQKVKEDMLTTAENVERIAATIKTIAARIREAELEAWRIANERKS